jgi:hypothetical protein
MRAKQIAQSMDIEFGNAGTVDTNNTGWFLGFSDWTKSPAARLRHVSQEDIAKSLCVKWFHHPKGDPCGEPRPLSEGRTISILVSEHGQFRLEFSTSADFLNRRRFVVRASFAWRFRHLG